MYRKIETTRTQYTSRHLIYVALVWNHLIATFEVKHTRLRTSCLSCMLRSSRTKLELVILQFRLFMTEPVKAELINFQRLKWKLQYCQWKLHYTRSHIFFQENIGFKMPDVYSNVQLFYKHSNTQIRGSASYVMKVHFGQKLGYLHKFIQR